MASSSIYSLITSKILLRAFKPSEVFNHNTSTVYHISKLINKTITISLSFTPLRKKFGKSHWGDTCRQAFFSIHTTRVYLILRHQYGWHRILRMKVIHADYVFFDMYGLCSVYSSFCKYTSTEDSHPWWIESLSVRICL